jgi:5-methylcytosine-specific restriction endonuclease McrA
MPRHNRPPVRRSTSKISIEQVFRKDKGICYSCGKPVSRMSATKDHVNPKSSGGRNLPSNVRLMHDVCNWAKGNDKGWK